MEELTNTGDSSNSMARRAEESDVSDMRVQESIEGARRYQHRHQQQSEQHGLVSGNAESKAMHEHADVKEARLQSRLDRAVREVGKEVGVDLRIGSGVERSGCDQPAGEGRNRSQQHDGEGHPRPKPAPSAAAIERRSTRWRSCSSIPTSPCGDASSPGACAPVCICRSTGRNTFRRTDQALPAELDRGFPARLLHGVQVLAQAAGAIGGLVPCRKHLVDLRAAITGQTDLRPQQEILHPAEISLNRNGRSARTTADAVGTGLFIRNRWRCRISVGPGNAAAAGSSCATRPACDAAMSATDGSALRTAICNCSLCGDHVSSASRKAM